MDGRRRCQSRAKNSMGNRQVDAQLAADPQNAMLLKVRAGNIGPPLVGTDSVHVLVLLVVHRLGHGLPTLFEEHAVVEVFSSLPFFFEPCWAEAATSHSGVNAEKTEEESQTRIILFAEVKALVQG